MSDSEYFTLVFKGDIMQFNGNPLKTATPFGVPVACGVGNVFEENDELRELLDRDPVGLEFANKANIEAARRFKAERDALVKALEEIRDHWANQYDHPRKESEMYRGSYGIGVTDGHRACTIIAERALALVGGSR